MQGGVQRGGQASAARVVPDEMAEGFVVCGTPDDARKKVEPVWEVAESLWLVPPVYALAPEELMAYAGAIAGTSYG